jgi:tetratricopeptide (TPR) repeat protein
MSGYTVVHVGDVPEQDDGQVPMRSVRQHLGITGFGVNAWTARNVGDRMIPEHREANTPEDEPDEDEELYLVLQGRAVFELDGERRDAPAGTFVFVRPQVNRTAFAEEPGTVIVSIGGTPGKPYSPVDWELWYPLRRLYERGEYAEVVERGRALLEQHPDAGLVLYNVACCECLIGDTTEALEHLGKAIELSGQLRDFAKGDSDLDAIRDDPAFQALVSD